MGGCSVCRRTLKGEKPHKGEEKSRADRMVPEEEKSQESYSGVVWVKLGDTQECNETGTKLQGRLKLRMEAGFCKKTRG
jgi:hypothetical protein